MRVRAAAEGDLDAAAELLDELDAAQAAWRVFSPRPGHQDEVLARYKAALDDPDSLLAVAEDGDRVMGMALARVIVPSSFSDERAIELSSVVVHPSVRHTGVGRALTRAVARFAGDRGVERITLKVFAANRAAVRFWEAVGFVPRAVQYTATADDVLVRIESDPGAETSSSTSSSKPAHRE
jgi:ribosomal protein S18 acetylase RimI-like enzyme